MNPGGARRSQASGERINTEEPLTRARLPHCSIRSALRSAACYPGSDRSMRPAARRTKRDALSEPALAAWANSPWQRSLEDLVDSPGDLRRADVEQTPQDCSAGSADQSPGSRYPRSSPGIPGPEPGGFQGVAGDPPVRRAKASTYDVIRWAGQPDTAAALRSGHPTRPPPLSPRGRRRERPTPASGLSAFRPINAG